MRDPYDIEQAALRSLEAVELHRQANKTIRITFRLLPEIQVEEVAPVSITAIYLGCRKDRDEQWIMDAVPEDSAIMVEKEPLNLDIIDELTKIVSGETKEAPDELIAALDRGTIRMPSEHVATTYLLSRVVAPIFTIES